MSGIAVNDTVYKTNDKQVGPMHSMCKENRAH